MNNWAELQRVPAGDLAALVGRSFVSAGSSSTRSGSTPSPRSPKTSSSSMSIPEGGRDAVRRDGCPRLPHPLPALRPGLRRTAENRGRRAWDQLRLRPRAFCPSGSFRKPRAGAFYARLGGAAVETRMAVDLRRERGDRRRAEAGSRSDLAHDAGDGSDLTNSELCHYMTYRGSGCRRRKRSSTSATLSTMGHF